MPKHGQRQHDAPGRNNPAKRDTDYVTWNRLLGVTNPARLDES